MPNTDARSLPPEALEFIRGQALRLRVEGYTLAEVAKVCGVAQGTVTKWARRADELGTDGAIKGLKRGRRHGSGRTLTLVQEEQLRRLTIGSNPAQLKFDRAYWRHHGWRAVNLNGLASGVCPVRVTGRVP
jgi:transposase